MRFWYEYLIVYSICKNGNDGTGTSFTRTNSKICSFERIKALSEKFKKEAELETCLLIDFKLISKKWRWRE